DGIRDLIVTGVQTCALPISPRTARVVNADRLIGFDLAVHRFRRRERNLAKRNTKIVMQFSGDVNLARVRKVVAAVADRGLCRSIDRKSTRLNSSHDQISYAV